jgi:hypothetical protein
MSMSRLPVRAVLALFPGRAPAAGPSPARWAMAVTDSPPARRARATARVSGSRATARVSGSRATARVSGSRAPGRAAYSVALAAGLRLAGHTQPGEIVASVLGAAVLAVLIFNPPPRSMPLFPVGDGWAASTALWSCLTVIAAALTIAASRDAYRR